MPSRFWKASGNALLPSCNILAVSGGGSPPVLSAPTGTKTASTTATIGATTDTGSGTLYWVITTGSTAPTAAQVKAGQDSSGSAAMTSGSQAVSSTGVKTVSATGLTASNAPFGFLMHESAGGQSNVVQTGVLLGAEIVVDGGFTSSANWATDGAGFSVSGGQAVASSGTFDLYQGNAGIVSGHVYQVTFTVTSYTSGTLFVYLGTGQTFGVANAAAVGTVTQNITPGSSGELGLHANSGSPFTGTADNFSVKEVL